MELFHDARFTQKVYGFSWLHKHSVEWIWG